MEPSLRLRVSGLVGLFGPALLLAASTCAEGATASSGVDGGITGGNPPLDAETGRPDTRSFSTGSSPSSMGTGQNTGTTPASSGTGTTPPSGTSGSSTSVPTTSTTKETHTTGTLTTETGTVTTESSVDTETSTSDTGSTDTLSGTSSSSGSTPPGYTCSHSPCVAGAALPRNCDQTADGLADAICSSNGGDMPSCCTNMWSNACAQLAVEVCGQVTCEDPGCAGDGDAGI